MENNIFRIGEKVEYNGERYTILNFKKQKVKLMKTLVVDIYSLGSRENLNREEKIVSINDIKKIHSINDFFYIMVDNEGSYIFIDDNEMKKTIETNYEKYKSKYKFDIINCRSSGYQKPEINVRVV